MSFSSTSSALISDLIPFFKTVAVSGAKSIKDFKEERAFSKERASRKAPKRKRKVTAADSTYSPIIKAPITAMVTKSSMLNIFNREACQAFKKVGIPAIMEAAIKSESNKRLLQLNK